LPNKECGVKAQPDNGLKIFGVLTTIAYLALICLYAALSKHALLGLKLNELGDFLAGAFSPVAFFWLVLGFFQQGKELRLQVEELKNSVEQQRELVGVSRDQLDYMMENEAKQKRPNIKVNAASRGAGPDGLRVEFKFTNYGYLADDFKAELRCVGVKYELIHLTALKQDGECKADYRFPGEIEGLSVSVTYNCGEGNGIKEVFLCKVTHMPNSLPFFAFERVE
jgi:hypothetical protein